ncbi:MAG: VanZ family protein [Candidatus Buchananbacteria bacterium]
MKNYKIILSWFLVFAWLGVIYYFSSQPNLKSEFKPLWDLILRKAAHMAEFFVLAFFLFKAYKTQGLNFFQCLAFSLISAVVGASFDEWHQSYTVGRVASPVDVSIDSLGVAAFTILKFIEKRRF